MSQLQESWFCNWHGILSNRKIRLMNDFHRALLRSPQIPLTFFFTFHKLSVVMDAFCMYLDSSPNRCCVVLPQVCSSFPGVVSRPPSSRSSHPLPLALALAHAGAQGVLVMNKGRTRLEWGVFDKPDAFFGSWQQFS